MQPKVSIIIPVYNGANYLSEAIDSALRQTYKNVEIIVVNDGSCDNGETEKIALSYGDKIRYFAKENGGVSSALNFGIKMMDGDYFSWLSHDDLYADDKIEKQLSLIEDEKDIVLCPNLLIDGEGKEIAYPMRAIEKKLSGVELFREVVEKGYQLNGLGFLVPRKAFEEVGCFDEGLRYVQDWFLWCQMMLKDYRFICQAEKLTMNRIHKMQVSNRFPQLFYQEVDIVAKKTEEIFRNNTVAERTAFLKLYLYYFQKVNSEVGKEIFKRLLLDEGEYTLFVRMKKWRYCLKGITKRFLKRGYIFLMKAKGCRG